MPIVKCPSCHSRYDPGLGEELDDLLSDQDMEEISQAIALFEGRLAPAE